MLFDTEFLIAFAGGRGAAKKVRATLFLESHDAPLYIPRVCWAEFAEGCEKVVEVERHLRRFAIVEIDEGVAWEASRIGRELKGKGLHIGDNDVWIAATARAHGLPLVSNNAKHLGRVKGLDLRGY